jgi:hypothetical protein
MLFLRENDNLRNQWQNNDEQPSNLVAGMSPARADKGRLTSFSTYDRL